MRWGLYTKLAKSPAYSTACSEHRIDGSGGLALPKHFPLGDFLRRGVQLGDPGKEADVPGFFLVLWTSLRLSFMDTLPADESCRSSH